MQERTEARLAIATEQGFAFLVAYGTMLRGWALAMQGHAAEGMVQIRQGSAAHQTTEAELYRPYFLALLAAACREGGQVEEGLRVLHEAFAAADKNGERWWEAERHRLKGELLVQDGTGHKWSEGGGVFSSSPRRGPPPAGEVARAAGDDEPESAVAAAGQAG